MIVKIPSCSVRPDLEADVWDVSSVGPRWVRLTETTDDDRATILLNYEAALRLWEWLASALEVPPVALGTVVRRTEEVAADEHR